MKLPAHSALEASRASLAAGIAKLTSTATRAVLRIQLRGTASPSVLVEIRAWLETALAPFPVTQVVDETRVVLTAAELADLQPDRDRNGLKNMRTRMAEIDARIDMASRPGKGTRITVELPLKCKPPIFI